MKKLIPLLLLLVLTGCATASKYQLQITEYERPLPKYPLKATVYYKPNVKDGQLFEMEYNEFSKKAIGSFRAGYGVITFTKFNSAFNKMFKETERSMVSDRPTRLLEAKSKNTDLLCDVEFADYTFKWDKEEGFAETYVKGMFNPMRKPEYSAVSDFKVKLTFYKPDGSIVIEKAYPYSESQPVNIDVTNWNMVLFEISNEQLKRGVDEIIGNAVRDLGNSSGFKDIIDSKQQAMSQENL